MNPFVRLERPTVFISASKDMHHEASIAVEVIEEISRNSPPLRQIEPYLWAKSDQVWRGDATWQEMIPNLADPMIVAVVCLIGERLGEPLPPGFPLPADFAVPAIVQFPWQGGGDGRIPLTGTLFEYLCARDGASRVASAGERAAPLLVYLRADAGKATSELPADQRDLGFWRHYETVSRSRRRDDVDEYFRQLGFVSTFIDQIHQPRQRGTIFLGQRVEDFRQKLRSDLVAVLDLPASTKKQARALKGLLPYDVDDRDIFAGRTRTVDKIFREIERKAEPDGGPTAALIVGTSGAGKSSVLRAGVAAAILDGMRNTLTVVYRAVVATPRLLLKDDPVATLGALLASEGVLPELGRADDLSEALAGHPDGAIDKLLERITQACALASQNEQRRSRFGVAPKFQLVIGIDQVEEMVADTAGEGSSEAIARLVKFLVEGTRRRVFWMIGSLADARLSRWNRLLTEDGAHFDYWPLGNPDWECLNEIVETSFEALKLPIDARLKDELIRSCQGIDRTGTATLPLLSVAMTRLADAIREHCLVVLRQQLADSATVVADVAFGDLAKDQLANVELPDAMIAKLLPVADVKSAVDELAEQAWSASVSSAAGESQTLEIGRFLRRLIAIVPNASKDSISLLACPVKDPALARFAPLIDALRSRRILTDVAGDQIQIVHEAVVRHWRRAEQWFKQAQQTLLFLETIRPLARNWSQAAAAQKRDMVLPLGYCNEAQRVLVDWYGDYDHVPIDFIRASLAGHAAQIVGQHNEDGWSPLGVASHLGDVELVTAYLAAGAAIESGGPDGATPLHYAENGATAAVLLARGLDVNVRAADGTTALHGAARNGRLDVVRSLLDAGADIDATDAAGLTALHHAVTAGQQAIAELLLGVSGDVDRRTAAGATPLTLACGLGYPAMAELLLKHGADVHLGNGEGHGPLHSAVATSGKDCVEVLLRYGAADDKAAAALALRQAAERGLADILSLLISFDAPVDSADHADRTPLYHAAQKGHVDVVAALLRAGADANRIAADGASILHAAATCERREVVEEILARTRNINAQDRDGRTALHLASNTRHVPTLNCLFAAGVDTSIEDSFGFLPLARAIETYESDAGAAAIAAFLDAGVSPNQNNSRGLSPLGIAASAGVVKTLKLLLSRSEPLDQVPRGGGLLIRGVFSGNQNVVQQLCDHHVPIDETDSRGMSALMYACWASLERLAATLLELGADPNAKGPDGWSPLMFAAAGPEPSEDFAVAIVRRLLKAGARFADRDAYGRNAEEIARSRGLPNVADLLAAAANADGAAAAPRDGESQAVAIERGA